MALLLRRPLAAPTSRTTTTPRRTVVARANVYKVTFKTPDGEKTIECPDDRYLLEHAESQGVELPYSCRAASCFTCTGKIVEGEVDQEEVYLLGEDQKVEGFILTCATYPKSDLVILTHQEKALGEKPVAFNAEANRLDDGKFGRA